MAAAGSGADVRWPGRADRSFRPVFLAGTVGTDTVGSRTSEIEAVAKRSDPVAGLPAAANRAARRDGRAAETAGHAADDRPRREAGRPVHFDAAERGGLVGRVDPPPDGQAGGGARVLLHEALRPGASGPVLRGPGFLYAFS